MIRSSLIRFWGWLFLTLALLCAGVALFNHFRPYKPIGEELANDATDLTSGERTVTTSETTIEPSSPSVETHKSAQNLQLDDLYRALEESSDPQEKRKLRKQLASIKPGEVPFRFALAKYANANAEEEKLHLQSIIAQIGAHPGTAPD